MPSPSILLDECIDRRIRKAFGRVHVKTSPEMGWAGLKNGKLLAEAEKHFDVFITVDRNLSFQQPVSKFRIAIVVLHAKSNRVEDLLPLVPQILRALTLFKPGHVFRIH